MGSMHINKAIWLIMTFLQRGW